MSRNSMSDLHNFRASILTPFLSRSHEIQVCAQICGFLVAKTRANLKLRTTQSVNKLQLSTAAHQRLQLIVFQFSVFPSSSCSHSSNPRNPPAPHPCYVERYSNYLDNCHLHDSRHSCDSFVVRVGSAGAVEALGTRKLGRL